MKNNYARLTVRSADKHSPKLVATVPFDDTKEREASDVIGELIRTGAEGVVGGRWSMPRISVWSKQRLRKDLARQVIQVGNPE